MNARQVVVGLVALVVLAVVGSVVGAAVAGKPEQPQSTGARQAVDAIAVHWPITNAADTTGGCAAKQGDTAAGCVSRVTTSEVTVAEYADEAGAKRAVGIMRKAGDYRQAGVFVLSWTAREQDLISERARDDMVRIVAGRTG